MNKITAVVLDTETTGLRQPQPIEVGYLALQELNTYVMKPENIELITEKHFTFNERFKPTKAIDKQAQIVHGISLNDLLDKPAFSMDKLNIPDSCEYMICHNVSYDWRVLGKPTETGLKKICTLKLAKALWPGLDSYKLTSLMYEFFPDYHERVTVNAHGALVDCRLTLALLAKACLEFDLKTWADFYEIAGQK